MNSQHFQRSTSWSLLPLEDWGESETGRAINELRLWTFFDLFEDSELPNIAHNIHILKLVKNEVLFHEGCKSPRGYFLYSGVIKLYTSRRRAFLDSPKFEADSDTSQLDKDMLKIDRTEKSLVDFSSLILEGRSSTETEKGNKFEDQTNKNQHHRGELNTSIGKGQWCGLVASLSGTSVSTSAIADSEVTLYCLEPSDLLNLFLASPSTSRAELLAASADAAFLQYVPPFRAYAGSDEALIRFARAMRKAAHPAHTVLFEQARSPSATPGPTRPFE